MKNYICDICGEPFKYCRKRKHCPSCASGLIRQYKTNWRLRHPDYNREYLREWKRELREMEREIVQRNKNKLATMA